MGLFTNNKKLCPICGNPTPRLLADKVEGEALCKECSAKLDLPAGALSGMTLDGLRAYLAVYDENEPRRSAFCEDYRFDFGFFGATLLMDTANRLLRIKPGDGAFAFGPENLRALRILADGDVIIEATAAGLRLLPDSVPERAEALRGRIEEFRSHVREWEWMDERHARDPRPEGQRPPRPERPRFDCDAPVDHFYVEIDLDHPYWSEFRAKRGAPGFDRDDPSVEDYLAAYEEKKAELLDLARHFMAVLDPTAPETDESAAAPQSAAAAPAQATDVAEELKKYKSLLDAGILTEEEFTAKKRQLLGI